MRRTKYWLRSHKVKERRCACPESYGRPFVSKLWHDMRAVFSHVYLQSFLLHDIRAFFVTYTCVLFPSIWPFSYKRAYICAQKSPYICVTNKHVVYAVAESRRIKFTDLQKTPSCTAELKSNFSLNQAWPQCRVMYRSPRSFNMPSPRAYPGHLTPLPSRGGGNLIIRVFQGVGNLIPML